MKQASELRKELSKMDLDPGYFCKFVKDQYVRKTIKENRLTKILDIGCDTGYMAGLLEYDNYIFEYTGVDVNININPEFFERQGRRFILAIDTIQVLKECVDRGDLYDCVLMLDVIEHFDNKEQGIEALQIACDVVKPGGFLFISTPNSIDEQINWPEYHKYEYSSFEIIGLWFLKSRFKVIDFFGWSMSDEMFDFIVQKTDDPESYFANILPNQMARVLTAINYPTLSRDFMFVLQRRI